MHDMVHLKLVDVKIFTVCQIQEKRCGPVTTFFLARLRQNDSAPTPNTPEAEKFLFEFAVSLRTPHGLLDFLLIGHGSSSDSRMFNSRRYKDEQWE